MACVEFLRWLWLAPYKLLVRVLFLLIAAYALEQRHGEERVEHHDKQDVEVSIVISLPGTGGTGGHRYDAGLRRRCAAGESHFELLSADANRSVLQYLPASGQKRKEEGSVYVFHTRIKMK